MVEEVPPHQTVAAPLVDVKPCAAGDDKAHAVFVEVEKSLEKRLPADELVNFVERDDGPAVRCNPKPGGVGKACRVARDELTRCEVIPRKVSVRKRFCERSLSALARPCEERHLAVVLQMLFKNRLVDSLLLECVFHGAYDIRFGSSRQYQTDRSVGMVKTKLTHRSVWCRLFKHTGWLAPSSRLRKLSRAKKVYINGKTHQ